MNLKRKTNMRIINIILIAIFSAFCLFLLTDLVAAISNPADYNFGSPAMIGAGGWKYNSLATYILSGVIWIFLSLLIVFASMISIKYINKKLSSSPQK